MFIVCTHDSFRLSAFLFLFFNVYFVLTGTPDKKPWLTTYASWGGRDPCATIHTRGVCIFSPEDLPGLIFRPELFANKFYITHYPAALHCLDQLLFNLTFARAVRDLTTYRQLPFVIKPQRTNKTDS